MPLADDSQLEVFCLFCCRQVSFMVCRLAASGGGSWMMWKTLTNRHTVHNSLAVTKVAIPFSFHYAILWALAVFFSNFSADNTLHITFSDWKVSLNGLRLVAGSGPVTRIQTVMTPSWLRPWPHQVRLTYGNGHEKRGRWEAPRRLPVAECTSVATSSPGAPAPWPCCYRAAHG